MRKIILALATAFALAHTCDAALADGASATAVSTGTIDINLAKNWGPDTEWLQFCGYHSCGDGGGGMMHHNDSCTPDGILCFSDSAGHHYKRNETVPGGRFDARKGGCWIDGTHDDAACANAVLTAAGAADIATVVFPGMLNQASADLNIPDGMAVDFASVAIGRRNSLDYRTATIPGGMLLPSTHTINLGCSSGIMNGTILRSDGTYSPAIFKPVSFRDKLNVQAGFAGTAITADCNNSTITNITLLGFGAADTPAIFLSGAENHIDHIYGDCTSCVLNQDSGGGVVISDFQFGTFLTHGGAMNWTVDNIIDDGSGACHIVAEVPTTDVTWQNGDIVNLGTAVNGGAQSCSGQYTLAAVSVVAMGTDSCQVSVCQEATLTGSTFTNTAVTASWPAVPRGDGALPVTISAISGGHNMGDLAVGQIFTDGGACIPVDDTIVDVWPDQNMVFLDPAVALTSAGSSASASAANGTFDRAAHMQVLQSAAQHRGYCMKFVNTGGAKLDVGQCYVHDVEIWCADSAESLRLNGVNTGENTGQDETDNIGLLIDGDHTGKDCGGLTWSGGIAGQHITRAVLVNSDNPKPNVLTGVGVAPGNGHTNGVEVQVEAGNLALNGDFAAVHANVFIADGTTFSTVFANNSNLGSGYLNGETVTTSGGTCSQQAQAVLTVVAGVVTDATESRPFICTVVPTSPITTTGGSGTGLKLNTDGFIASSVHAVNFYVPQSDFYRQTYPGTAFSGINNTCLVMIACNTNDVPVSIVTIAPQTAPGTPASGASVYIDSADGKLKIKFANGNVVELATP